MPIKITREPAELAKEVAERCAFCSTRTRHWHEPTNTPVCPPCAQIKTVTELRATSASQ